MSKYYLVEKKSGLGIFTIDFILLILFALGFGLNIILAFIAAIGITVVLFLLMTIPYFGRVVVCACGCSTTYFLYSVINGFTGWFTKMYTDKPLQWWLTVIFGGLIIIALHWAACPSPHSNGTIIGDDGELIGGAFTAKRNTADFIPREVDVPRNIVCGKVNMDEVIVAFNSTQARYEKISEEIADFGHDNLPREFLEVLQNANRQYDTLENRMRSYLDLYNDSSESWRSEVGEDILQKAETANDAIRQLESSFRLLTQASENRSAASETSFFRGCNTLDELNKRYHNLAKTFHPDLDAGDEETMKQINEEFERMKSVLKSNGL